MEKTDVQKTLEAKLTATNDLLQQIQKDPKAFAKAFGMSEGKVGVAEAKGKSKKQKLEFALAKITDAWDAFAAMAEALDADPDYVCNHFRAYLHAANDPEVKAALK